MRRNSCRQFGGALLLALVCFSSWAGPSAEQVPAKAELSQPQVEAQQWFQKVQHNANHFNYDLALVHQRLTDVMPVRYSHAYVNQQSLAYLSYLNGPPRDYILRQGIVSYLQPEFPPFSVAREQLPGPLFALLQIDPERLYQHYELIFAGRYRIASRPAQALRIVPKDPHRFGYVLWLDADSVLPLQLDVLNADGQKLEQWLGVALNVYKDPQPWVDELAQAQLPALTEDVTQAAQLAWQPSWLPEGFVAVSAQRHRVAMTEELVDYRMYSDGLTTVSIYVGQRQGKAADRPAVVTNGATSLAMEYRGDYEYTVVGEIPVEVARRVLESIEVGIASND